MTNRTVVIESKDYTEDVDRLMKDPVIQRMAEDFKYGIKTGDITVEWLDTFEALQAANAHARANGVTGRSLGAVIRAVRALVKSDN